MRASGPPRTTPARQWRGNKEKATEAVAFFYGSRNGV